MTKFQIVDMSNGGFEVVASGLTWVDACNQCMSLEYQVGGRFRDMQDGWTIEQFDAWQDDAMRNYDITQGGWAYL